MLKFKIVNQLFLFFKNEVVENFFGDYSFFYTETLKMICIFEVKESFISKNCFYQTRLAYF